jgi:dephospho-CoA kinase
MLVVGLTGGIGSGKSAVSRLFEDYGVPVIDADHVAREVVEPGSPALDEIVRQFGDDVLLHDGRLDRANLRHKIFNDQQARKKLETILHPRIRQRMRDRLQSIGAPYAIFVVPLLIETGQHQDVDRVLVVDCPEALQMERVKKRDSASASQITAIMASQVSREQRLAEADDIIENRGSLEELNASVSSLHQQYLELSQKGI